MKCTRGLAISVLALFIMTLLLSSTANAKLAVSSPEGMIERSNFIFTGIVVEKNYTEEQRTVKIEIDLILKGTESISEVTLTQQKQKVYGWLGFDFPDVGNKVFVLLNKSQQDEYMPCSALNYVAIVNKNNKISMYNGHSINGVVSEDYAAVYDKFYRENISKASVVQKNTLVANDGSILSVEPAENKDDNKPAAYILIGIFVVLTIISILLLRKGKLSSNAKRVIYLGVILIIALGSISIFRYKANYASDLTNSGSSNNAKSMFEVGDYILFGKYNKQKILWRVINIDETGSPLILMENVIAIKSYDSAGSVHKDKDRINYGSNYWENSNIRQWLNSENKIGQWIQNPPSKTNIFEGSNPYDDEPGFLSDENFTADEKKIIIAKKNKVLLAKIDEDKKVGGIEPLKCSFSLEDAIEGYDNAYYMEVSDKVRLLSVKELYDYVYKRGYNIWRKPTKEALEQNTDKEIMNYTANDYFAYWLRDPEAESSYKAYTVIEGLSSHYGTYFGRQGIVACLNLDKTAIPSSGKGDINSPYVLIGKVIDE